MNPKRFSELREKANLTQSELAELMNLSIRTIASWESGERKPPIDKFEWLADFYHVDTDYILGRSDICTQKHLSQAIDGIHREVDLQRTRNNTMYMSTGKRIKQLRVAAGLTQSKLSEIVGKGQQAVSKWENDQSIPDFDSLTFLAQYFCVSIDYLLCVERIAKMKQPSESIGELRKEIIPLLEGLSDSDLQRVWDFVAGLKSARTNAEDILLRHENSLL